MKVQEIIARAYVQWGTAGGEIAVALNNRARVKVHGQSPGRLRVRRPGSVRVPEIGHEQRAPSLFLMRRRLYV